MSMHFYGPAWPTLVGIDFETEAVHPLPIDPQPVCMSVFTRLPLPPDIPYRLHEQSGGVLYLAEHAAAVLDYFMAVPDVRFAIQYAVFDVCVAILRCGVGLARWVELYDAGRIHDSSMRERLIAIARGWTEKGTMDPRTGRPAAFSLADIVQARFGVDLSTEKTDPRAWRLNYALLLGIPLEHWPEEAVSYAVMDSVWAVRAVEHQQMEDATLAGPVAVSPYHITTEIQDTAADLGLYLLADNMPLADAEAAARFEAYHRARMGRAEQAALRFGMVRWNKLKAKREPDAVAASECPWGQQGKSCCGVSPCRGGYSMNTSVMKEWVQEDWGDATPLTETGQVSTAKDVLTDDRSRPLLRAWGMAAFNRKMISTNLPILRMATTRRVRSRFTAAVNTGRTACGRPVNWQNPPKFGGFRDCFVPSPGNVFASIDYTAIEVAALAQILLERFGRSNLADTLNAGRDVHRWFSGHLVGRSYDEMVAASKDPATKDWAKAKRQGAKAAVFGIPGGMGARRMVDTYGVDSFLSIAEPADWASIGDWVVRDDGRMEWVPVRPEEADRTTRRVVAEAVAKRVRQIFLDAEPAMALYFQWVSDRTPDGSTFTWRDPVTGFQRGAVGYSDGCNTQFQGRTAAGAKRALWQLTKACYGVSGDPLDAPLAGVRLWNFVHDEFLFEGPEETAHEWAMRATTIMVEAMREVIPDVQVQAEPALMRRWLKAAEPVTRAADGSLAPWKGEGRLVPWEAGGAAAGDEVDPMDEVLALIGA